MTIRACGAVPILNSGGRVTGTVANVLTVDGTDECSIPGKLVSYTFMVSELHLDVPIPAKATESGNGAGTAAREAYRLTAAIPLARFSLRQQSALRPSSSW